LKREEASAAAGLFLREERVERKGQRERLEREEVFFVSSVGGRKRERESLTSPSSLFPPPTIRPLNWAFLALLSRERPRDYRDLAFQATKTGTLSLKGGAASVQRNKGG